MVNIVPASNLDTFSMAAFILALVLTLVALLISILIQRRFSYEVVGIGTTPTHSQETQVQSRRDEHRRFLTSTQLGEYIATRSRMDYLHYDQTTSQQQIQLENVAQWLQKGDPQLAIELAKDAQRHSYKIWEPLLQVVASASVEQMPPHIEQLAANALANRVVSGEQALENYCQAIILYRWSLNKLSRDDPEIADIWYNIAYAYSGLPVIDPTRSANLRAAIACYQIALPIYANNHHDSAYAATMFNLGNAYSNLLDSNKQTNLEVAIACYQTALNFYKYETMPIEWATAQHNLGNAYHALPGENRKKHQNLVEAITHYEAALKVYHERAHPGEQARTLYELGLAYSNLPNGDRQQNLREAITNYERALPLFLNQHLYLEYARTCYELGLIYIELGKDYFQKAITFLQYALQFYEKQRPSKMLAQTLRYLSAAYLEQSDMDLTIKFCQRALGVYQDLGLSSSKDWAFTQRILGQAYFKVAGKEPYTNLNLAIKCFLEALKIYNTQETLTEWADICYWLGKTYYLMFKSLTHLDLDQHSHLMKARNYIKMALDTYQERNMNMQRVQEAQEVLEVVTSSLQSLDHH